MPAGLLGIEELDRAEIEAILARGQELAAARIEAAVQLGQERQRVGGQDLGGPALDRA